MRKLLVAVLYTALLLGANAAPAADVTALVTGEMKKLALAEAPVALPEGVLLLREDDSEARLEDWRGKWVVLNFWATWCAPCRTEMPSLDRLQVAMPDLVVLPVATGRNDVAAIARFYSEAGVSHLPTLRDPHQELSRAMGVLGLPVTVIVNPEGQEVARLIGGAEWDSPEALAMLAAWMAP